MRKRSASHDLGTFPSPGAPQYRGNNAGGFQKGWASERVAGVGGGGGRQSAGAAGTMATFNSGRTLPSKWEDAERWICSPLNGNGNPISSKSSSSLQPQKRPKSKSGPIVHTAGTAAAHYSSYGHSPAAAAEGGSLRSFAAGSPFSTGVLAAESVYGGGGVGPLGRLATSIPGWPELKESHCCPSPKISLSSESNEGNPGAAEKSEETAVSRAVSQRDMATQMSPRDCRCSYSSTVERLSFASSPPALLSITERQSDNSAKLEVRDVQVDKRATMIKWSKKRGIKMSKKGQNYVDDFGENAYEMSEAEIDHSKLQREEAKITAWENLQKAKAEAAIRKLEMKLEKKRSATMDKIVDKLRTAEFKAHKMRSKLSGNHVDSYDQHQVPRTPPKFFSFRKHVRVGSLSRLFVCHAF